MKSLLKIVGGVMIAVLALCLLATRFYAHADPLQEIKNEHALPDEARQPLIALAQQADAIVVSKVLSARSYWPADGSLILTDYQLETVELLHGGAPSVFTLTAEGGVVDDIRLEVSEGIKLESPASYVLFLRNQDHRLVVLQGARGAYKIDSRQSLLKELKTVIQSVEKESRHAKP